MALSDVFKSAATTAFKVFASMATAGTYVVVEDNGIVARTESGYPVSVIISNLSNEEVKNLSFKNLIQPTDAIGLIEGPALAPIEIDAGNLIRLGADEYSVVAFDVDPAKALWIVLMRKA